MASSGRIWRACCWWCLLLCFLPKVEASTRKSVTLPSVQTQVEQATADALVGDALVVTGPALEGEFIEAATKNVPVRGIVGGTSFGLNTIAGEAKGLLKNNLAGLLIGAGLSALLEGVGWVETDGALVKKLPVTPAKDIKPGDYYWSSTSYGNFNDPVSACSSTLAYWNSQFPNGGMVAQSTTFDGPSTFYCHSLAPNGGTPADQFLRKGSGCTSPLIYSNNACVLPAGNSPLVDSDYDAIDNFLPNQNADFIKNVLMDSCKNAPTAGVSVSSCYQAMKKESIKLTGPLSVSGSTETTTGTYAKPDGTTGSTTTTTSTNYTITYGDSYYDYTTNKNVVSTLDGVKTTDQTTSDGTDPTDEQPDDDKTSPSPCASNCDGPAYTDLYTPTTDTKETFLGRYKDKVGSIPVLSAASGFFTVSASAGCPVWQVHTDMAIMQADLPINLVFDFHCQPWFVSAVSFASVVMSIVCAYYAFRIAFLD